MEGAYDFVPTEYCSGAGTEDEVTNAAGTNSGSCKLFYFAQMHNLEKEPTLRLFCEVRIQRVVAAFMVGVWRQP